MFPPELVFSQSALQDYLDCPRRFDLRYRQRLTWPAEQAEPAQEFERRQRQGERFHRLAHQWMLGLPADRLARMAAALEIQEWWQAFVQTFGDLAQQPGVFPEVVLSAPLAGYRLMARFDLIVVRDGRARIYDWKTYHRRPKDEWMAMRMQTRVYRYLLAVAGQSLNDERPLSPEQIEMVYWYVEFPHEPAVFRYDRQRFSQDRDLLERLVEEIAIRQVFDPTDDEQLCLFCPYRSYCQRGTSAGDWRQAELEAEGYTLFDIHFEQIGEVEF